MDPILFKSASNFGEIISNKIIIQEITTNCEIVILIDSYSNTADLYSLGRFISILIGLKKRFNAKLTIDFLKSGKKKIQNLYEVGFFPLCKEQNINYENLAFDLSTLSIKDKNFLFECIEDKKYWKCIIPLIQIRIKQPLNETEALAETSRVISGLSKIIFKRFDHLGIQPFKLSYEINRILFGIFKELILNSIIHSYSDSFYIAMTVDRETSETGSRARRSGKIFDSGQDKFDTLVLDFGQGVFNTVEKRLSEKPIKYLHSNQDEIDSVDYSSTFFDLELDIDKNIKERSFKKNALRISYKKYLKKYNSPTIQERSLLETIFLGNLLARKGRKSEGLFDVASYIEWFDGILSYKSGRSEVLVKSPSKISSIRKIKRSPYQYFTPGVIASALIPSHTLRLIGIRKKAQTEISLPFYDSNETAISIANFSKLPKGLFGGQPISSLRRKSEIYARYFIEEYNKKDKSEIKPFCYEIDLSGIDKMSIDFIDTLLQSILKINDTEDKRSCMLYQFYFVNVPRNILHKLKKKNCTSFLKLKKKVCLMLDESDSPHFLGVSRFDNRINDLHESLCLLYYSKGILEDFFKEGDNPSWTMKDDQFKYFKSLFSDNERELLYRKNNSFFLKDVSTAIKKSNFSDLLKIEEYVEILNNNSAIHLDNGNYVNGIIRFSDYLKNIKYLKNLSKLLFKKIPYVPVNTLVGFMYNGDTLSGAIQNYSKSEVLLVVDLSEPDTWDNIAFDSDFAIVLNVIYPGDENGRIADFINKMDCFFKDDIVSPISFAKKLLQESYSPSMYLCKRFSNKLKKELNKCIENSDMRESTFDKLIYEINSIMMQEGLNLYNISNFSDVLDQDFLTKEKLLLKDSKYIIELNTLSRLSCNYLRLNSIFIEKSFSKHINKRRLQYIVSAIDLRKDSPSEFFNSVPVVTYHINDLKKSDKIQIALPKIKNDLNKDTFIYKTSDVNIYPDRATGQSKIIPSQMSSDLRNLNYSYIELSSEFWHNVSSLDIISSIYKGREKRNLIFFENNEKIIKYQRTRTFLKEFLFDFIREKLRLQVDIIFYPSHPVGAFLGSLVANQLNREPLCIELQQEEYGGKIKTSKRYFKNIKNEIEVFKRDREKEVCNVIILDDSIYSGSSIFTMIGLASKLNLNLVGIFVILNRLSSEMSAVFDKMPIVFSYLYRLHMPTSSDSANPNKLLKRWATNLKKDSNSFFVISWCDNILSSPHKSYFLQHYKTINKKFSSGFNKKIKYYSNPTLKYSEIENLNETTFFYNHEIKQIIQGLILHEDSTILNFYTRIGIVYNFLEGLVEEKSFWHMLEQMVDVAFEDEKVSPELFFLQKILVIMAFSDHIAAKIPYHRFRNLLNSIILKGFSNNKWITVYGLISDCFMALSTINDHSLIVLGKSTLSILLPIAYSTNDNTSDSSKSKIATQILNSYAWSLRVISYYKNFSLHEDLRKEINEIFLEKNWTYKKEFQILLIDIFSPLIKNDEPLRRLLSIKSYGHINTRIDQIRDTESRLYKYLSKAPGYTMTLGSIIFSCDACVALLYAKNKYEELFYYRAGEMNLDAYWYDLEDQEMITTGNERTEEVLPSRIRERMKSGKIFWSDEVSELSRLDYYTKEKIAYKYIFGSALKDESKNEKYYLVIGFRKYGTGKNNLSKIRTAFFYWKKIEPLIKKILFEIHEKHITSSQTISAIKITAKTTHPPRNVVNPRKKILTTAIGVSNIQNFIARLSGITAPSPLKPRKLVNVIWRVLKDMRNEIKTASDYHDINQDDPAIPFRKTVNQKKDPKIDWPVNFNNANKDYQGKGHLSFHITVLEFILRECINNALIHYHKRIDVQFEIQDNKKPKETHDVNILLRVTNDFIKNSKQEKSGIETCQLAAHAVRGNFNSKAKNDKLWEAVLCLRAHSVPIEKWRKES